MAMRREEIKPIACLPACCCLFNRVEIDVKLLARRELIGRLRVVNRHLDLPARRGLVETLILGNAVIRDGRKFHLLGETEISNRDDAKLCPNAHKSSLC